jgi:hypothetical protein
LVEDEFWRAAEELEALHEIVAWVARDGKLPAVSFRERLFWRTRQREKQEMIAKTALGSTTCTRTPLVKPADAPRGAGLATKPPAQKTRKPEVIECAYLDNTIAAYLGELSRSEPKPPW